MLAPQELVLELADIKGRLKDDPDTREAIRNIRKNVKYMKNKER